MVITDTYSLYVADLLNHRVQKFTKDSSIGVTVAGQGNGAWNNTNTTLERPAAILLDSDENLYIADSYNFRVLFWKNGAQSGNVIAGIGSIMDSSFLWSSSDDVNYCVSFRWPWQWIEPIEKQLRYHKRSSS